MKKVAAVLLCAVLCFVLCSCMSQGDVDEAYEKGYKHGQEKLEEELRLNELYELVTAARDVITEAEIALAVEGDPETSYYSMLIAESILDGAYDILLDYAP